MVFFRLSEGWLVRVRFFTSVFCFRWKTNRCLPSGCILLCRDSRQHLFGLTRKAWDLPDASHIFPSQGYSSELSKWLNIRYYWNSLEIIYRWIIMDIYAAIIIRRELVFILVPDIDLHVNCFVIGGTSIFQIFAYFQVPFFLSKPGVVVNDRLVSWSMGLLSLQSASLAV